MTEKTLNINVTRMNDNMFKADEITLNTYINSFIDDLKSDVQFINICVKTGNGTVEAILNTDDIKISYGRFFDFSYISDKMEQY